MRLERIGSDDPVLLRARLLVWTARGNRMATTVEQKWALWPANVTGQG